MKRAGALVVSAGVLLAGCSGDDGPDVRVEEVGRGTVSEVVDAPATITARSTSTVTAPADGTVAALVVPDGATVRAGDVLARIDSPAAQERLAQARSTAAGATARVQLPQADLSPLQDSLDQAAADAFAAGRAAAQQVPDPAARAQALQAVADAEARYAATAAAARSAVASVGSGVGSVEDALNAVGSSQRAQAQALVTAAEATVDALTVRAPQDGVVTYGDGGGAEAGGGDLSALVGQLPPELAGAAEALGGGGGGAAAPATSAPLAVGVPVASGAPLLTVTDLSGLGVTAEVDETDVLLVRPGVQAGVELDAVPGAEYTAAVTAVDVTPTAGAGGGVTYRVRLSLAVPVGAPAPLPGMSAVVDLRVREAVGALSVPSAAVVRDGAQDAVFVEEDGAYRRREVELGALGEDAVEVVSGLRLGERVVVSGADQVSDGQSAS